MFIQDFRENFIETILLCDIWYLVVNFIIFWGFVKFSHCVINFCKTLMYDSDNDTQVSECDVLTLFINKLLMCSLLSRNFTLTLWTSYYNVGKNLLTWRCKRHPIKITVLYSNFYSHARIFCEVCESIINAKFFLPQTSPCRMVIITTWV